MKICSIDNELRHMKNLQIILKTPPDLEPWVTLAILEKTIGLSVLQIRRGKRDNLRIIFNITLLKTYVVTHH